MSERYNPERFKRILKTRGPEKAGDYIASRRGARLRTEDNSRAAQAHLREAFSGEINSAPEEVGQRPPRVWAGVYLELLSLAAITSDGTLIADPLIRQPRQVGQGLSFG